MKIEDFIEDFMENYEPRGQVLTATVFELRALLDEAKPEMPIKAICPHGHFAGVDFGFVDGIEGCLTLVCRREPSLRGKEQR